MDALTGKRQVLLSSIELSDRFLLADLEPAYPGGLFEDRTPLDGVGLEHDVHLALLDDRVGVGADAGVQEQVTHVAQTDPLLVDQVLAGPVAVELTGDIDGIGIQRQLPPVAIVVGVVERQGDRRHSGRLSGHRAVENHVEHGPTAKALGGLLAENPFDRVNYIGFTAAVGAYDSGDRCIENDVGAVSERLKAA